MSVRMRHTRAHTGNRRSHHALKGAQLSSCSKCSAQHLRHHACEACGNYRGREVLNMAKGAEKKIRRAEKASKAKEDSAS